MALPFYFSTTVAALAVAGTVGGAVGWFARDRAGRSLVPVESGMPGEEPDLLSAVAAEPMTCDDSFGADAECPALSSGKGKEGACSDYAAKRCSEYKSAFKPRVAEAAVACIRRLRSSDMCDAMRVNECGHAALMAACTEAAPTSTALPSGAIDTDLPPAAAACEVITKACAGAPLAPTMTDCRQTLSGMTSGGRDAMVSCMTEGCGDRGLLGCEGVAAAAEMPHG